MTKKLAPKQETNSPKIPEVTPDNIGEAAGTTPLTGLTEKEALQIRIVKADLEKKHALDKNRLEIELATYKERCRIQLKELRNLSEIVNLADIIKVSVGLAVGYLITTIPRDIANWYKNPVVWLGMIWSALGSVYLMLGWHGHRKRAKEYQNELNEEHRE